VNAPLTGAIGGISARAHSARRIRGEPAGCHTLALDVTDEDSRHRAVRAVEAVHGSVGVLVNAAGYAQSGPVEEVPLEAVRRQFEVNLFGVAGLCQEVLPGMRAAGRGRIVSIGSAAGLMGLPACASYAASKWALEAYTDALRYETRPFGVRVILLQPGSVAPTNFTETEIASWPSVSPDGPYARFKESHDECLRRMTGEHARGVSRPEDVARVVLRAATTARPRARYEIGFEPRVMPAVYRLVPATLWDAIWRRYLPMA
jgi:NAD(P)-dependent dehydrogenase (short-subunit alcohol dehydrogenase family)